MISSSGWVIDAGLGETLGPQGARVALAAGPIATPVARPGEVERRLDLNAEAHDVGLAEIDQRRADLDRPPLDPPLQRQGRGRGERLHELGPAVWIAAVVEG